jgi:Dolichyl-phosphate-mannose-protein mannosyltransferase
MRYWLLFIVIWAWSIDYHHVWQQDPSGIHFIRQTDGLSFAGHYYHGHPFFEPGTYNQFADNGQVACEFPIFYFITAKIYYYTGIHFPILRLLHGLASLLSLILLFKWFRIFTKNLLLTIGAALFLLTSVVYGYYAFNFLPDAPALAFAISGWYFGWNGFDKGKRTEWIYAAVFFGLAGLIKPTFFIHGIACGMTLLWEWYEKRTEVFRHAVIYFFSVLSVFVMAIVSWNLFVTNYNAAHHDQYFLITTRPIWGMDAESIRIVWDHVTEYWFRDYFARDVWKALAVMLAIIVFRWKKLASVFQKSILILLMGSLSYFVLFFGQFRDHDYYALNIFPLFLLLLMAFISVFVERLYVPWLRWMVILLIFILGLSGWNTNHNKLRYRWVEKDNYYAGVATQLKDGAAWISIVPQEKPIGVIPDRTRNGSLLFCDHIGYTIFDSTEIHQVTQLRDANVEYLLVLNKDYLQLPEIRSHWKILKSDTLMDRYLLGKLF